MKPPKPCKPIINVACHGTCFYVNKHINSLLEKIKLTKDEPKEANEREEEY
jgi:hypothetical protein